MQISEAKTALSHPKYRPDIDGLRAVAILSVVLYHAFPYRFTGGFVGVDIFFVISGYLISTIIFSNLESETFSFREFYARRIRRIFPALLVVLFSCLLFGWYTLFDDEFEQLGKHIGAGAGFVSNLVLWGESGYFDNLAEHKPLLHLWSLGIEEQFYIVWPVLAWFAWRSNVGLLLVTVALFLGSFLLNIYSIRLDAVGTFYSPLTRVWELSVGGVVAHLITRKNINPESFTMIQANVISAVGFTLLAVAILTTTNDRPFPGWWATLPVLGSALVISAGVNSWLNRFILSNKVAVGLGVISYPLYLWHWPLFSYARIIQGEPPERSLKIALIVSSVCLAYLTYRFMERPLRFSLNGRKSSIRLVIAMSVLGSLGLGIARFEELSKTRLSEFAISKTLKASRNLEYPNGLRKMSFSDLDLYTNTSDSPEVVLFGDSHMAQYGPRVTMYTEQGKAKNSVFITAGGCPPIPNVYDDLHPHCKGFVEKFEEYLREHHSIKTILIGACWNCYFLNETAFPPSPGDRFDYYYQSSEGVDKFRGGQGKDKSLIEFSEFCKKLSREYHVYVLLDAPGGKEFDPSRILGGGLTRLTLTFSVGTGQDKKPVPISVQRDVRQTGIEDEMKRVLGDIGITVLGQSQVLCQENLCASVDSFGRPIYRDVDHIRPFYIREKMNVIDEVILK